MSGSYSYSTTIRLGATPYKDTTRPSYIKAPEITGVCNTCSDNPFTTTKRTVDAFGRTAEDKFTSLVCDIYEKSGDEVPNQTDILLSSKQMKQLGGCPSCRASINDNRQMHDNIVGTRQKKGWFAPHFVYDRNEKRLVRNKRGRNMLDGTKGTAHFIPVDNECDDRGNPVDTASFSGRVWEIQGSNTKQFIRIKIRLFPRNDRVEIDEKFDSDSYIKTYREGKAWYVEFEGEPRMWRGCIIRFNTGSFCKAECKKCDVHSNGGGYDCEQCDELKCNRHKLFTSWGNNAESDCESDCE